MKKKIRREITLTGDEVAQAVLHWLKTVKDQPTPEKIDDATIIAADPILSGGAMVAWTEETEIK